MHRITVVTTGGLPPPSPGRGSPFRASPTAGSNSSRQMPPSPVPGLEAASDCSSYEPGTPVRNEKEVKKQPKVSKWRQRALCSTPTSPDPAYVGLDLSLVKRRDLPIKLMVDEPVPVAASYDEDPFAQTTENFFRHTSSLRRQNRNKDKRITSSRRQDQGAENHASFSRRQDCDTEKHTSPSRRQDPDRCTIPPRCQSSTIEEDITEDHQDIKEVFTNGTSTNSWLVSFGNTSGKSNINSETGTQATESLSEKCLPPDPSDLQVARHMGTPSGTPQQGTETTQHVGTPSREDENGFSGADHIGVASSEAEQGIAAMRRLGMASREAEQDIEVTHHIGTAAGEAEQDIEVTHHIGTETREADQNIEVTHHMAAREAEQDIEVTRHIGSSAREADQDIEVTHHIRTASMEAEQGIQVTHFFGALSGERADQDIEVTHHHFGTEAEEQVEQNIEVTRTFATALSQEEFQQHDLIEISDHITVGDVIRCNGPVVRMKFGGEIVSVSEGFAARLCEGDCAWV